jgi:predicted transcriptional regulator
MGQPSQELDFRSTLGLEQTENQECEQPPEQVSPTPERLDVFFEPDDKPTNTELREAIMTVAGIRPTVFRVYLIVLDNPGATISEVATILETAYSNARRRLKELREKGLVSRHRIVPSCGGQKYQYHAQSLAETSRWLRHELAEWQETVHEQVRSLQTAHTA